MSTIKSPTLLTENGLSLLDHEVKCHGIEFIKKATGIDLSEKEQLTPEEIEKLRNFEAGMSVGKMSPSAEDCSYNQKTMREIAGLTIAAIFLLFIIIIVMAFLAEGLKDVIIYILGVLSTIAAQIYSYYFGSSVGSGEARNAMMKNIGNGNGAEKKPEVNEKTK